MISNNILLTLITFLPVLGMIVILAWPKGRHPNEIKMTALVTTGVTFLISLILLFKFDYALPSMQFEIVRNWIPQFNIFYHVGIDGMSLMLVILTTLLTFICCLASWNINDRVKGYFAMFLLLETGMLGVFVSLDLILFYLFWEVMLLPMYFLIGIWGGPRREYAAIKFFLYTLFGGIFLLLGILGLYFYGDPHTFNMLEINQGPLVRDVSMVTQIIFVALFIGFAIKVPIFPFHTWLPDAHVEAPTAVSVILAGVLLKMGTYGMLRLNYLMLPDCAKWFAWMLAILGLVNIVYGALCAMAQTDLKKLVAYSSISHMGYCLLGMAAITSWGVNGAVLQMFNHGTITAMMFLLVGVIYERAHHRDIDRFGGLARYMPVFAGVTAVAWFAALGLPALSGFISEMMVFVGAFDTDQLMHTSNPLYARILVIAATSGIILTAGYMLWSYQRMFLGTPNPQYEKIAEINARELCCLIPLAIIVIIVGVYPSPVIDMFYVTINNLVEVVRVGVSEPIGMR